MTKANDSFACGIRFLMAIGPEVVDEFFAKVRETIDPYECRCQSVSEEISLNQVEFGVHDAFLHMYEYDFGDDPLHWMR